MHLLNIARIGIPVALVTLGLAYATPAYAQDADPDLIKLGQSLLPDDPQAPKKPARPAAPKASASAAAATKSLEPKDGGARDAGRDAGMDAAVVTLADAGVTPVAAVEVEAGAADAAPVLARTDDAPDAAIAAATAPPPAPDKPTAPPPPKPPSSGGVGRDARNARIASGENAEPKGVTESPLAKLGVPTAAVPVVATATTAAVMGIWPFVVKTVTGLLKSFFAAFLKSRAKKDKKIAKDETAVNVMGFTLRPAELAALLLGALVYGLAVTYTLQGRKMSLTFLSTQEALLVAIYYTRSMVRFVYERIYRLPTRFTLWLGGGLLCLVSAYLGTTLSTVGYELEEGSGKEAAERLVKMKVMLTAASFVAAVAFFVANSLHPMKILQAGQMTMAGMALADILPLTPMPGRKIFGWNKAVWTLLAAVIVPGFVLINYVL